jgi:hypothetical protein
VLEHGSIPHGRYVLHRCDNRRCCNPSHLFVGTQQDNMDDMLAKGREGMGEAKAHHGSAHGRAKLTEADVLAIRAGTAGKAFGRDPQTGRLVGRGARDLAERYGVSVATINQIARRHIWKHI